MLLTLFQDPQILAPDRPLHQPLDIQVKANPGEAHLRINGCDRHSAHYSQCIRGASPVAAEYTGM